MLAGFHFVVQVTLFRYIIKKTKVFESFGYYLPSLIGCRACVDPPVHQGHIHNGQLNIKGDDDGMVWYDDDDGWVVLLLGCGSFGMMIVTLTIRTKVL